MFILDTSTDKIVTNSRLTEPKVRTLRAAGARLHCSHPVHGCLSKHGARVEQQLRAVSCLLPAAHAGDCMGSSGHRAQLHVCDGSRHGRVPLGCQPLQCTGESVSDMACLD